jgi:hypothetical protein
MPFPVWLYIYIYMRARARADLKRMCHSILFHGLAGEYRFVQSWVPFLGVAIIILIIEDEGYNGLLMMG